MMIDVNDFADLRAEVSKLCAAFPGECWRALDREAAYPAAFVNALTSAGYLAALIPEECGGSGLPFSAAAGHPRIGAACGMQWRLQTPGFDRSADRRLRAKRSAKMAIHAGAEAVYGLLE
jgi:alkylation response protein AidB-like acyl-CoA dehydrogenase